MRKLVWLVGVALCVTLALAALAPAWLVDRVLRSATDDRLGLANTAGTIWNGSGDLIATAQPTPPIAAGLHWSLSPRALLAQRAQGLLWQDGTSDASDATLFSLSHERRVVRNAHLQLNATAIGSMAAPGPWKLQGNLELTANDLALDTQNIHGAVEVKWRAALLATPVRALSLVLGEVRMPCVANGAAVSCRLENQGGDLQLRGDANWSAAQGLHLQGEARPTGSMTPQLAALMQQLGQHHADGAIRFGYTVR